jgi:hypothetical protein
MLSPSVLIIGPEQAVMEASLMPSGEPERLAWPGRDQMPAAWRAGATRSIMARIRASSFDDVLVADDQGARYALRVEAMEGPPQEPGQVGPIRLRLGLDPVPPRECRWLELRNQNGSATRLLPAARPTVRVSQLKSAPRTPAGRALARQALSIISVRLPGIGEGQEDEYVRRGCSAALARAAELRQSGELDPASELPDQIARLCAALTGHHPAEGLPPRLDRHAQRRADGPPGPGGAEAGPGGGDRTRWSCPLDPAAASLEVVVTGPTGRPDHAAAQLAACRETPAAAGWSSSRLAGAWCPGHDRSRDIRGSAADRWGVVLGQGWPGQPGGTAVGLRRG